VPGVINGAKATFACVAKDFGLVEERRDALIPLEVPS
jgi:hypothetical protein